MACKLGDGPENGHLDKAKPPGTRTSLVLHIALLSDRNLLSKDWCQVD